LVFHIHRNAELWMVRTFNTVHLHDFFACLVGKEINRVRCVVPLQVIRPRTGLTGCVDVLAAQKIRLHVHLLDIQLTGFDLVVKPLPFEGGRQD
tara:strand:+ start:14528 stop:14809 length:282 start_codon:yes stop_codon:yes gene_type:complete